MSVFTTLRRAALGLTATVLLSTPTLALDLALIDSDQWSRAAALVGGYEAFTRDGVLVVVDERLTSTLEAEGIRVSRLAERTGDDQKWCVVDLQGRGMHSAATVHLRPAAPGELPEGYQAIYQDGEIAVLELTQEEAHELHDMGYEFFETRDRADHRSFRARQIAPEVGVLSETESDPTSVLAALEPARRKLDHEYLVGLGTRHYKTEQGDKAALFMKQRFEEFGLAAEYNQFTYRGKQTANTVGTLEGSDPSLPMVLITAHMDSIRLWGGASNAPGADDNASGSSAMLAVARAMSKFQFKRTIKFIAFHAEEVGLIGSKRYADMAAGQGHEIVAVLNMDMLGFGDGKMEIIGDNPSAGLVELIASEGSAHTNLEIIPSVKPNFWYSDHSSFWRKGYQAVLISEELDNFNPHIHTTRDTFDKISHERIDQSLRVTVAAAVKLAELEGSQAD